MNTTSQAINALSIANEDLAKEARKHIEFLQGLHSLSVTLTKPSRRSLHRYLNGWLPLVAQEICKKNRTPLIPPPDIAWLWHCHRLSPSQYEQHVQQRFQKIVDCPEHAFDFQAATDKRSEAHATRNLWLAQYPDEPFFLCNQESLAGCYERVSLDGFLQDFDLLESTKRQATFLWQVSGPRFSEMKFLQQGVINYTRFLQLFATKTDTVPLVPTYQIDLMWHTHMLKSINVYNQDCIRIAGQRFNHDDSLNDRVEGGALDTSFQDTMRLWKEVYGIPYAVEGGMYRGEPPQSCWRSQWEAQRDILDDTTDTTAVSSSSMSCAAPQKWLSCAEGITHNGKPAFIKAEPRSRTRNVNTNPQKQDYLFGQPMLARGPGYYHMYTHEGWGLLLRHIKFQRSKAQQEADGFLFDHCSCSAKHLNTKDLERYHAKQDAAKECEDMEYFATAQYYAEGPGADVGSQLRHKYGLDNRKRPKPSPHVCTTNDTTYHDPGLMFYGAAASCGGGASVLCGGGCGGGTCGGKGGGGG